MKNKIYSTMSKLQYPMVLFIGFLLLLSSCLKENISPAAGQANPYISLIDVRKVYKGTEVILNAENLTGSGKVTGVVVSDAAAGNMPAGTFAIQQTRRGYKRGIEIVVAGASASSFKYGDSVSVDVIGGKINRKNGALQIEVPSLTSITKEASGILVEPRVVNLAAFNAKFEEYESTLLKVANVDAVADGNVLSGDVTVSQSVNTGVIHTEATAGFASKKVALNASYTGVARYYNANGNDTEGAVKQLWLLNGETVEDESGSLYEKFPEDFETADAVIGEAGYSTKTGNLLTGNYTLTNTGLNKDGNDRATSGVYALRMNGNGTSSSWITMNYDLPNGASKLTIWAGSYGASADLGSTWRIEYSQNRGTSWSQVGADILTVSKDKQLFTFLMDLRGPVRFRIGKLGIGASTSNNQNGRFSFDDLAIYKNTEAGGPITNPIPAYENVLAWQFAAPLTTGSELTINSTATNSGLTTAALTRGTGLNTSGAARAFGSNAAGPLIPVTKAIAISQNTYFQVKFTVKPGSTLSISAIDVKIRRSGAGAKYHKWFYSLNNVDFTETNGTGDINYEGTTTDGEGEQMPTYYLYQTPQLQSIPAGTTVTLRMYNWGYGNIGSGSFAIGRTPVSTTTPALTIGGKVNP
ncbi:DUF5689 domain-containing protein [Pedobacter metabolipauper]|nr:DUF5689 domain-containing protein [Pedobacter metabolipauper]